MVANGEVVLDYKYGDLVRILGAKDKLTAIR